MTYPRSQTKGIQKSLIDNNHFDGLVQYYSNSNANALELLQSRTKPINFKLP